MRSDAGQMSGNRAEQEACLGSFVPPHKVDEAVGSALSERVANPVLS